MHGLRQWDVISANRVDYFLANSHHTARRIWRCYRREAKVTCGDNEEILGANQSTYVPQCTAHRLENPGVIKLVLIEVQNGEYLGEDDIVRFQDDYARHQS